jgi:NAD(P)-dependent dehydrogenase (short-subunit alcohol dehydrogenase family)/rhamnose utilization protein RhaD (predicted bifunctional aldolase and dehydrogenase)
MSEHAGWCEMNMPRLRELFDRADLADLPPDERERGVLQYQLSCVTGGPGERPSVEAALHALLGHVVIHTHPVAVNALTCGPGETALAELTRDDEPPPLWVDYTDPGYTLALAVKRATDAYAAEHGAPPQALFLQNHGLFVSAPDAEPCIALHNDWCERCEAYFAETAPPLQSPPDADAADVRKAMAWIRRIVGEKDRGPVFARLSADPELLHACADASVATVLVQGALTPDQIVYTGAHSAYAASLLDIEKTLGPGLDEMAAPPRLLLVQGVGAFVLADEARKLDTVETVASSAAKTIRLANGRGGAHNLAPISADFIIHWEVEHYRAKVFAGGARPLTGKVAIVTGAASGLGLGIAHGLAEAGAAVAHCDIDDDGLAAAVDAACDPSRALAVHMDVTDELAVAKAFDAVIRRWGGVDVVVCAAGIAPPYPLVEMPVEKWRLALEINLTGYFLVAREGARVMQPQGGGGAMVMVSSKSGLEASKANSAYNATKAGELHLMRGWALELGSDGIRVNAVAPGNVFEGSKIWNPDYIEVCAEKKGIEPEEVIPYYVNMTSLKREIKREDVASAVVFLCSDAARCVTGQTLVVDGGQVMVR